LNENNEESDEELSIEKQNFQIKEKTQQEKKKTLPLGIDDNDNQKDISSTKAESLNETQSEQIADKVQTSFLKHTFVFQELLDNVQDIYTNAELLTVYDPRSPMTKR
ncbi:unnamed protein product, partial [Rotaria sp. Silwood1]